MQRRFLRMACLLVVACAMSMSPTGASMRIPRLAGRAQRNLAPLRGSRCAAAAQTLGSRWPSISILGGEAGAGVGVVRMVLRGGSADRQADRRDRGNMDDDDDDGDDDARPDHRSMEVEDVVDGKQQDAAPEGAADAADDEDSVIFLDEDERVEEQWSGEGAAQESLPVTDPNAPNFGEEGYGSSEFSSSQDEDGGNGMGLRNLNDDSIGIFPHNQPIYSVAFSPFDEDVLATGGGDDKVRIWSLSTGKETLELEKFEDTVTAVGFSHDGTYLAAGSMDGSTRCWLSSTGELAATLYGPSEAVLWMEWHPRGPVILAGSDDGYAFIWEVCHEDGKYDGRCLQVFSGHSAAVSCGGFADRGKLVVTGCDDATIRIFSPKDGRMLHSLYDEQHLHGSPITALACHPTDPISVSGDKEGKLQMINVQQGKVKCSFQGVTNHGHFGSIEDIKFSKAMAGCVITGSMDGTMRIWDMNTGFERSCCDHAKREGVTRVACLQRRPMILTGTTAGRVCVWDGSSGAMLKVFGGHKDIILDLAVHREEEVMVTGGDDRTSRMFSLMSR